jgi:hypothetical protein
MEHLPAKYGREAYLHLMANKSQRISAISSLLDESGITPEPSIDCWHSIGEWLYHQIEASREWQNQEQPKTQNKSNNRNVILRPLCYSLLIDLSLLFGEHVISNKSICHWFFWDDAKIVNPQSLGRSPWVLCEQMPTTGQWRHIPDRFVPFDMLRNIAKNMLKDKLSESQKRDFNLGELFRQLITEPESQPSNDPYDSEVADLCLWFDEYRQDHNLKNTDSDSHRALDTFLRQYVDTHGFLPQQHDLGILQNKFGSLPDWLKSEQSK